MKKILSIIILFSTLLSNCSSQKKIDSKKLKEEFLKWIIEQQPEKMVDKKLIEISSEKFWELKGNIEFSKEDSIKISEQIQSKNQNTITVTLSANKVLMKDDKKENKYLKISNPIFFGNGKKIWIYMQHICPTECWSEDVEVYEISKEGYKKLWGTIIYNRGE